MGQGQGRWLGAAAVPWPSTCLSLHRYVLLSRPFCFEPSTPYEVTMRLQRAGVTQRHPGAFILIDSVRGGLLHPVPGPRQGGVLGGTGDHHGLGWAVTCTWSCT